MPNHLTRYPWPSHFRGSWDPSSASMYKLDRHLELLCKHGAAVNVVSDKDHLQEDPCDQQPIKVRTVMPHDRKNLHGVDTTNQE